MKYIARRFKMKSGEYCVLRSPDARDAAQRIAFLKTVNAETSFMARGEDDSPADIELVAELLDEQLEDDLTLEIAAFVGDEMIACGGISPVSRAYQRKRHRAVLGICVRKAWWGQGLGSTIVNALCAEAAKMNYSQIELTVVADNIRACTLYERCGFVQIGCLPGALKYEDGTLRDEIWMSKEVYKTSV